MFNGLAAARAGDPLAELIRLLPDLRRVSETDRTAILSRDGKIDPKIVAARLLGQSIGYGASSVIQAVRQYLPGLADLRTLQAAGRDRGKLILDAKATGQLEAEELDNLGDHGRRVAHQLGVRTPERGQVRRLPQMLPDLGQVPLEMGAHRRVVRAARGAAAGKHLENEMAPFLDCIATGRRPLTDGPGSLQGLRIIWRLYEAEQQHTIADLRGLGLDEIDLAPQARHWTGVS